jgi:hypothetical protein
LVSVDGSVRVDDVKAEWKQLWRRRIDDKVRAEGVSGQAFPLLFLERGTVIAATRDFKPLCLKEILNVHKFENVGRLVGSNPALGGWTKFARTVLNEQARCRRMEVLVPRLEGKQNLQVKKGGRGWLHKC